MSTTPPPSIMITGASSGIGEALARLYAGPGVHLALSGRSPQRLQAVADTCRAQGAEVDARPMPVTDRAAMEAWVHRIDERFPLDLVIANAGISGGTGGRGVMSGESSDQTRAIFDTNVTGVLNTVLPALDGMRARKRGQIALMASLAGYRGLPSAPAYCASKAAVKAWGEGLRGWLAADGIRVSVICPGFVKSRITDANDFPMPFLMGADKAARIICRGLERNQGRIAFPWPSAFAAWLGAALPAAVADQVVRLLPAKK